MVFFSFLRGRSTTSELTIPRNLRGRFRGSGEVGDVRDRVFQHLKIDFSTLNPGVQYTGFFVQYTGRRLVKYWISSILDAGLEWLGRSDFEPGCLSGLVRRRWFALLGTRVQAPASSSPKILQKSSKSEKIRGPGDALSSLLDILSSLLHLRPVYYLFRPVYCISVQYTGRGASASVLFSPVRHSEVLSGAFAVSLWASLGTRTKDLDVASPAP